MLNKRCPECRKNGHDRGSDGGHMFLLKDGITWGCFRGEYHNSGKPYISREDGNYYSSTTKNYKTGIKERETISDVLDFPLVASEIRKISSKTYQYYEVRCSYDEYSGEIENLYFPIKSKGNLIGFHRRNLKDKSFSNIGSIAGKELDLFGLDKCSKTGKNIIITEGHLDALSIYEVVHQKYPKYSLNITSVNNGLGSLKEIGLARNDLSGYEDILIAFDMDQPGREGISKVFKMLGSKIKTMDFSEKDANDTLSKGKSSEIINAFFNPRLYTPSDIVTLDNIFEEIITETPSGIPYPWNDLNDITYGIFSRQIISIGAGVGSGKTTFMNQLSAYLIKEHHKKIGIFSLEETPSYTSKKLIGSLIGKRLHLPGVQTTKEEIKEVFDLLKDYIYIYDTQGFLEWEDIKQNIRYLASIGCSIFIIDPLTAVTANYSASEANEILNSMMAELSGIVQSLDITVFLVSHLNNPKTGKVHSEGGKISGEQFTQSRALHRWSHTVLGLERNLQSEDESEKNTMTIRVLKNRLTGETGTVELKYNKETGILESGIDYGII